MKQIELYNELISLQEIAHIINNVPFSHKDAAMYRKAIVPVVLKYVTEKYNIPTIAVLKPGYARDVNEWINGNRLNWLIKAAGNVSVSSWESEVQSLTRILIRNGFSAYVTARNTTKNLFKPYKNSSSQFYGRASCPEYIGCSMPGSNNMVDHVVRSGLKTLLVAGQKLSHDKDRIAIPMRMVTEVGFLDKVSRHSTKQILVNIKSHETRKNVHEIIVGFRHIGNQSSNERILRRINDHMHAALCSMPHVSNIVTTFSRLHATGNCNEAVCIRFTLDLNNKTEQPMPKEVKRVITSPAELSNATNITDADITVFLNRRISELSDEIGSLISHRDTITEQINQKSAQQCKFKQILEAL